VILSLEDVQVRYGGNATGVTVADKVNLAVARGQTHGLVGESGSGKSTIARAIMGLAPLVGGTIRLDGEAADPRTAVGVQRLRGKVQMVFQNPYASLNPRMTVGDAVREALAVRQPHRKNREAEARRLLSLVGLDAGAIDRFPHQFSGGQRQRIAIARALATAAPVLILDEVTSALDVSVQATVLNLLRDLQAELGLSYLFISHDLAAVRHMSDIVSVMYLGRIVETAPRDDFFAGPRHPYATALLASVPGLPGRGRQTSERIGGEIGDPKNPPPGCRFHPRCPAASLSAPLMERCSSSVPALTGAARKTACHLTAMNPAQAGAQLPALSESGSK